MVTDPLREHIAPLYSQIKCTKKMHKRQVMSKRDRGNPNAKYVLSISQGALRRPCGGWGRGRRPPGPTHAGAPPAGGAVASRSPPPREGRGERESKGREGRGGGGWAPPPRTGRSRRAALAAAPQQSGGKRSTAIRRAGGSAQSCRWPTVLHHATNGHGL